MKEGLLIYPHQLFSDHPCLRKDRRVYLYEDQLFFKDFNYPANFHSLKLIFHRASMAAYKTEIESRTFDVTSIKYSQSRSMDNLFEALSQDGIERLHLADPVDFMAMKRLQRFAETHGIELVVKDGPGFLLTSVEIGERFSSDAKQYRQTSFYREERIRRGILVENGGAPVGGQWSFDPANRKKLPKDITLPPEPTIEENDYVREARESVLADFPNHPGAKAPLPYPVTRVGASRWLNEFLEQRLARFGPYEDAMTTRHRTLYHSVLSPLLNVGLLTPQQVLDRTLEFAADNEVPIESLEGFIRQILGWREFVRGMYQVRGTGMRTTNALGHDNALPDAFYTATTGLPPLDMAIQLALDTAYLHHIERLMLCGNAMLLLEIDPGAVYTWFMELFIDAYDWVMVPNVYGMSQYADGGLMVTKPYVSSSNYLRKMGDFERGEWEDIWDGLYWRFVSRHKELFDSTPRLAVMARQLEKMDNTRRTRLLNAAEEYMEKLWG